MECIIDFYCNRISLLNRGVSADFFHAIIWAIALGQSKWEDFNKQKWIEAYLASHTKNCKYK